MKPSKHSDQSDRPVIGSMAWLEQAADRLSRFHRVSWREAFGELASPAFRLHRYRNAHNRLLLDALCELDCPDKGNRKQ